MKNFLNISDWSSTELRSIIDSAKSRKLERQGLNKSEPDKDKPFNGKSMVMIFEKPSTRTRISFDIAIMSNSFIEAACKFNFNLKIGCPKKYSPKKEVMAWAKKNKANVFVTQNPFDAVKDADCVMTDKWVSMNDKVNKKLKKKHYKNIR